MPEYVYGIVEPGAALPAAPGLGGGRIRSVAGQSAAALVSDIVEDRLQLGRDEVLAHSHVLEEALRHGTVLPMRLGIVMGSDEEVRDRLLERHDTELRDQLVRFRGKFEADVRATYEEDALMREVIGSDPEIARLRASLQGRPDDATYYERIQLGQLVAGAADRIRQADEEKLMSALRQVCLEARVSAPGHERVALNAAFLLDEETTQEFDEVLEAIAEGQAGRLRFRYTGPLPPHSFVELGETA